MRRTRLGKPPRTGDKFESRLAPIARSARHHCRLRACASAISPAKLRRAGAFCEIPRYLEILCHACVADPDPVAGADHRARHRAFRLCARAAGHARGVALVVFGGGLHEHHQRRRLSRRRAGRVAADPPLRACGQRALGDAGLCRFARALRGLAEFRRAELRAAARRLRRRRRLRRWRRAGGDDRAVAA